MTIDQVLDRSGHLTELACERLAAERRDGTADEDAAFAALARAHHDACPPCQARVAPLLAPLALPTLPIPISRARRTLVMTSFALAASAFLVAYIVTRPSDTLRVKGGAFDFEVQAADGRVLGDQAPVHPGDALYFAVRVSEPTYVAVWGLDQQGVRYPIRETALLPASDQAQRLPEAIELDAEGARETIVARACPVPFHADEVVAAECATRSVTLRKSR